MTSNILAGQTVLVTGAGRPRGIGQAAARRFAEAGAKVAVTDIARKRADLEIEELGFCIGDDFQALETLADEIIAAGGEAFPHALDLTEADSIGGALRAIEDALGPVDILINNAGTAIGVGPFTDVDDDVWELACQVNVVGTARICRAVLPGMVECGCGAIINNASGAGLGGMANMAVYVATKHAVVGLTRALAAEFGEFGVRVNAVCPGNIETDMGQSEVRFLAAEHGLSEEDARVLMGSEAALKRIGQPEEIAEAMLWLASPQASFATGVALPVTGGLPLGIQ